MNRESKEKLLGYSIGVLITGLVILAGHALSRSHAQPPATNAELSFSVLPLQTNWATNVILTIRTEPVPGLCPECGAANHHERRVESVRIYGTILLPVATTHHGTNLVPVGTTPTNLTTITQTVLRLPIRQPGGQMPPMFP